MEKTYHELENYYFDMRNSLLAETQKIEILQQELQEERQKKEELSVGEKGRMQFICRMSCTLFRRSSLDPVTL